MTQPQTLRDLNDAAMRAACQEALVEVLETMFFELPVDELQLSAEAPAGCIVAWARFHGSLSGSLLVAVPEAVSSFLAAGFLGLEEDELTDLERHNVVVELANMLCGATMSRLEPRGRLRIDQPEMLDGQANLAEAAPGPWLQFPLAGGMIEVSAQCGEQ